MVEHPTIAVAAFYRFARLDDLARQRDELQELCEGLGIRGILLLAQEGINGTLAAPSDALQAALAGITAMIGLELEPKFSQASKPPFRRLRVRIKREIVTIGDKSVDPVQRVGHYVEPEAWNALIADPDVLVIDTRNAYEVAVGSFTGAIDPDTQSFSEFSDYVRNNLDPAGQRKVALFCTGGIRCEKASSFMLGQGFTEVYHLKGGILSYLEKVPEAQSLWQGGCFVFDERVAVGHALAVLPVRFCLSCNWPLDSTMLQSTDYEEGVCCPRCVLTLSDTQKASARERQKQIMLAQKRGKTHLAG